MTAEKYVSSIMKKIQCGKKKKSDIKKQLLSEIDERISSGENIEEVIKEMGSIGEVADSFNEIISDTERRVYKRNKSIKIGLSIIAVLVVILIGVIRLFPKTNSLDESTIFDKQQVEETLIEVIDLMDQQDYVTLQAMSIPQMESVFNESEMEKIINQFSGSFGKRQSIGKIYSQEIIQSKQHFAVCQVTVSYENISITYTISFDENMKVAGLYMK